MCCLLLPVHPLHEILNGKFNEAEQKQVQMEIALYVHDVMCVSLWSVCLCHCSSTTYNGADFAKLPEYVIGGQKSNYTVADKGTGELYSFCTDCLNY